jgi:hypothetical protein
VDLAAPSATQVPSPALAKRPASQLRLVDETPYGIEFQGRMLPLGISREEAESVLGPPLRATDYPIDKSAMSGTTYLFYEDPGMSLRTKRGIVEGFYVYITGTEFDGMELLPAHPTLPHDIPLNATVEQIVKILGEPDVRDAYAPLNWLDLRYIRGNALIEYHFDKGVLSSVKVEDTLITARFRSPAPQE